MSRPDAVLQAERDCRSLFRKRVALLAALDRLEAAPPAERRELALQISLTFPGVRSLGYLVGAASPTRLQVLSLLGDERRGFMEQLLARVSLESPAYQALGQALPFSFPSPRSAPAGTPPPLSEGEAQREEAPVPVSGAAEPVEPKLAALLLRLLEGPPPSLPPLARPVSGVLGGIAIEDDPELRLALEADGSLRIFGSTDLVHRMSAREGEPAATGEERVVLTLEDGSRVEADQFFLLSAKTTLSIDPARRASSWHGQLFRWRWWRSRELRFWVALEHEAALPPTRNLAINHGMGKSFVGLFVPGARPAAFLANRKENGVLQVYRAGPSPLEERESLIGRSAAALCALTINKPRTFFGYDENMNLSACMEGAWRPANAPRLDDTPDGCLLVPSLWTDAARSPRQVWQAPFLDKLLSEVESWSSTTRDAIEHLAAITYESFSYHQISLMGALVRMILTSEGNLRGDDFLMIEKVQTALTSFAEARGLALPIAAWELSVGIYMTVKGFKTADEWARVSSLIPAG